MTLLALLLWGCGAAPLHIPSVRPDIERWLSGMSEGTEFFPIGTFACDSSCEACAQALLRDDLLWVTRWQVTRCQEGGPLTISLSPLAAQVLGERTFISVAEAVVEDIQITEQVLDTEDRRWNPPYARLLVTYRLRPTPIGALILADLRCDDPKHAAHCARFNDPHTFEFIATQFRANYWTISSAKSGHSGGGHHSPPF
jgi:hypothetical protein